MESHEKLAGGRGREGNDEESWWKGEGRGGRPFAPRVLGLPQMQSVCTHGQVLVLRLLPPNRTYIFKLEDTEHVNH